jgi:hypothetical protein
MTAKKHGGSRPGAGRPRIDPDAACVTQGVTMTAAAWALLAELCAATGKTQREVITGALEREAKLAARPTLCARCKHPCRTTGFCDSCDE